MALPAILLAVPAIGAASVYLWERFADDGAISSSSTVAPVRLSSSTPFWAGLAIGAAALYYYQRKRG